MKQWFRRRRAAPERPLTPAERLRAGELRRGCHVFLHRQRDRAIIASLFGGGIQFELDGEIADIDGLEPATLGAAACERFLASENRPMPQSVRKRKRTDWPAYRQSGCRSVAAFEREYLPVSMIGLNKANISVRLETEPLRDGVRLTVLCNPLATQRLGEELMKLRKYYLRWETA